MHVVSCTNTHRDVTDLANHGMVKNRKTWISWERNIIFQRNQKILSLCFRWYILRSYHFLAEVTFNELWPYYQKHLNQIILNPTTLSLEFCWLQIFHWIKLSRHLALFESNLDDSIDSGNFSVRDYLPLIRKDSSTNMHVLTVYVKEGLPFAWDLSLENSPDSYLCFWLALLHSVSYCFFLYWLLSSSLCMVFDSISSNIDEVLSINASANVFFFGDFKVHHKDWLTYSGGTD